MCCSPPKILFLAFHKSFAFHQGQRQLSWSQKYSDFQFCNKFVKGIQIVRSVFHSKQKLYKINNYLHFKFAM